MKKKTLYILMENQVRELNTYLLLSIFAAYREYRIYLGTHYSIFKFVKFWQKFAAKDVFSRGKLHFESRSGKWR